MTINSSGYLTSILHASEGRFLISKQKFGNNLIPKQIIYNDPVTVCIFPDGEKIVVKCGKDEKFVKENGVMARIVKKLFSSRSKFLKTVEAGYDQKEIKNKK